MPSVQYIYKYSTSVLKANFLYQEHSNSTQRPQVPYNETRICKVSENPQVPYNETRIVEVLIPEVLKIVVTSGNRTHLTSRNRLGKSFKKKLSRT